MFLCKFYKKNWKIVILSIFFFCRMKDIVSLWLVEMCDLWTKNYFTTAFVLKTISIISPKIFFPRCHFTDSILPCKNTKSKFSWPMKSFANPPIPSDSELDGEQWHLSDFTLDTNLVLLSLDNLRLRRWEMLDDFRNKWM